MRFLVRILVFINVSGLFLLSACALESCNKYFCRKEYRYEFGSGSVKRVLFRKLTWRTKPDFSTYEKSYQELIKNAYPAYELEFVIVDGKKMIDFTNVIFDGVDAQPSIFYLYEPSAQLETIKDFQINPVTEYQRPLFDIIFPVEVVNTFVVNLRQRLIDRLKAQDKLKFTLISHDHKEYVVQLPNFLKEYDF
ncbi:hypothetical protein [Candidatus Borreliella tachyglossi]|uniref:hypothetical protein n=1 Tax=Candidatus Borreliella tachyglossi TaxID=1964448 RepID=UPI004040F67E